MQQNAIKKVLSLLVALCLTLTLLPGMTITARAATGSLDIGGSAYSDIDTTNYNGTIGGGAWAWDFASSTLTLGAGFTTTSEIGFGCATTDTITIKIKGAVSAADIACNGSLTIEEGTSGSLAVNAAGSAITANKDFTLQSGALDLTAGGYGISAYGGIAIYGGSIEAKTTNECLSSYTGDIDTSTTGALTLTSASGSAIRAEAGSVTSDNATLDLDAAGAGIFGMTGVSIAGGSLTVVSGESCIATPTGGGDISITTAGDVSLTGTGANSQAIYAAGGVLTVDNSALMMQSAATGNAVEAKRISIRNNSGFTLTNTAGDGLYASSYSDPMTIDESTVTVTVAANRYAIKPNGNLIVTNSVLTLSNGNTGVLFSGGSATLTNTTGTLNAKAIPTLTSVTPDTGTQLGGTAVTVNGANLTNFSANGVHSNRLYDLEVSSATQLTGKTEARNTTGPVDLAVQFDEFFVILPDAYTYTSCGPVLEVEADSQNRVPTAGTADLVYFKCYPFNLTDGAAITLNNPGNVPGISLTTTYNTIDASWAEPYVDIITTADTPAGSHTLSITAAGATSNNFTLVVNAAGGTTPTTTRQLFRPCHRQRAIW